MLMVIFFSVDNSEYMRNGDYTPNRSEAQTDAVHLLVNAKVIFNK